MALKNEDADEKLFYTIGEVAKRFDVNASLIRFWEKEFDSIKPQKNKKGNRLFTKEDLNNFHLIFHLVKERGYTLQGAKMKMKQNRVELEQSHEVIKNLQKIRSFLVEMKSTL